MDFTRLLQPQTIAVVGASAVKIQGRYDYTSWISSAGFKGRLYPVNPKYEEVEGFKCYPALKDIPEEIDIAILMVPAQMTIDLIRETPSGKASNCMFPMQ